MDFRSVVIYLSMKDMNAKEIHADMNDTFGADCVGYLTVTKYRVSDIRCSTARDERGCAARPRHEQGKASQL
jgi:hypothetical protein